MPRPARALFRLMETAAARWCDRIICVCEYERRLALEKGIAVGAKLEVVLNGVRDVAPELRAQPGLSPVRICSVARFEAPKAHRTLIEALARLRTSPWELHLVGDGPREPEIRGLVRSLCLEDRVRFHGYLADPAPLLARSQLFVLSSRSEALPRSILEALRAGLPVVASRVGGVPEAVDDGVSGLLVPPSDAAALAGALERLAGDAALRQSMGASARSAFERRFRLEFAVGRTAAVYATVKSGPHGRGDLPS
jgi:glycosyltransferase involved in cell wall biosynthesis